MSISTSWSSGRAKSFRTQGWWLWTRFIFLNHFDVDHYGCTTIIILLRFNVCMLTVLISLLLKGKLAVWYTGFFRLTSHHHPFKLVFFASLVLLKKKTPQTPKPKSHRPVSPPIAAPPPLHCRAIPRPSCCFPIPPRHHAGMEIGDEVRRAEVEASCWSSPTPLSLIPRWTTPSTAASLTYHRPVVAPFS